MQDRFHISFIGYTSIVSRRECEWRLRGNEQSRPILGLVKALDIVKTIPFKEHAAPHTACQKATNR